jgi:hypothetical protein
MTLVEWIKTILGCKEKELEEEINSLNSEISQFKTRIELLEGMIRGEKFEGPKRKGIISYIDLYNLLAPYCKIEDIHLSDKIFSLTSVSEAKKFSESVKVASQEYKKESEGKEHDCDEFSFALMGYWNLDLYQFAFGIAWSKYHAFNIMVDDKKEIYVIEPQSNKFIPIKVAMDKSLYYPFKFVLI